MGKERSVYERVADVAAKHGVTVKPEDLRDADKDRHEAVGNISATVCRAVIEVSEDPSDAIAQDCAGTMRKNIMAAEHYVTEAMLAEESRAQGGRI